MSLSGDDARQAIRSTRKRLKDLGSEAARRLKPGHKIGGAKLAHTFPELSVPDDLYALWQETDGVDLEGDPALDALWLDGMNAFLSEEEAIDDYVMASRLQADEPEFGQYWPRGFVPVASPGEGSRLLVNCVKGSPTHGALYMLDHGVGLSRMTISLGQYFETILDWVDTNSLRINRDGVVELNLDASMKVAHTMNPGCDAWDGAMPPAHETRDWVGRREGNS